MRVLLSLVLIFTLGACATKKKDKTAPTPDQNAEAFAKLEEMRKTHLDAQLACHQQKNNILKPAFTEHKGPKKDEVSFRFVKDDKAAFNFISNFNVNNLALAENKAEYNFVLNQCLPYNRETFSRNCDTAFTVYTYFKGLVYGLSNYRWSQKTRKAGLNLVKNYAAKVSSVESSLIETSIAVAILKELADKRMINKTNSLAVNKLHDDLEKSIEVLRFMFEEARVRHSNEENIPCNEKVAIYQKENELTHKHGQDLLKVIAGIKF